MQTKSISMLCAFLSILGCVCACRPTTQPAASSPPVDYPDGLCQDASETYVAYVKGSKPGAGADIPSTYWANGIRALQPIRVYLHRANLVVVQQVAAETERGKYIQGPVSSYIPESGDDGFEFTPDPRTGNTHSLGNGVFDFKRTNPL